MDAPYEGVSRRGLLATVFPPTMADLARPPLDYADVGKVRERWGVRQDDPDAKDVLRRLERTWKNWPPVRRQLLLEIAECVARTEELKARWNTKVLRPRHIALARTAVKAADLASELVGLHPHPGGRNGRPLEVLAKSLMAFVDAAIDESMTAQLDIAIRSVGGLIATLRKDCGNRLSWELLRDLAVLASGGQLSVSEKTLRRYATHRRLSFLSEDVWRENFKRLGAASRKVGERSAGQFASAVQAYLRNP